jgi:hypothetical protein
MGKSATQPAPRLITDFPEFVAEAKRLEELHQQLAQCRAEESAVEEQLRRQRAASTTAIDERAAALADGASWDDVSDLSADASQAKRRELRERAEATQRAIRIQDERIARVRDEASCTVCGERKPEYVALVRRVADTLLDLSHVVEELRRFRFQLEQEGFVFNLPQSPGNLFDIGRPTDIGQSRAWHFLYEGMQSGFWTDEEYAALVRGEAKHLTRSAP